MTHFVPGKAIARHHTPNGAQIILRAPRWEDVPQLTDYINSLSRENTYLNFAGEQIGIAEESRYIASCFATAEAGDKVQILAFDGDTLVGTAGVDRDYSHRTRALHVGIFGISVRAEYRRQGIGRALTNATLDESRAMMSGLRLILLEVFGENNAATHLYEECGFIRAGTIPQALRYNQRYLDKIIMYRYFS